MACLREPAVCRVIDVLEFGGVGRAAGVEQDDHMGWVEKSQADFAAQGLGDAPVVEINNKPVKDVAGSLTPQKLRSLVLKEAKAVVAVQATPSPTNSMLG